MGKSGQSNIRMNKKEYAVQNLMTTTSEYAENATVHGIKYIFEKVLSNDLNCLLLIQKS